MRLLPRMSKKTCHHLNSTIKRERLTLNAPKSVMNVTVYSLGVLLGSSRGVGVAGGANSSCSALSDSLSRNSTHILTRLLEEVDS